jgi:hypothetical protein
MKRFHALEWEDLQWFPNSWRDYGTDYLQFVATRFDIYKSILPILKKGINASPDRNWVDVASGGGGGLVNLVRQLKNDYPQLSVILSDYYPNVKAFERTKATDPAIFLYEKDSTNAMDLPKHLHGMFRTMFASFHHFRPSDAQKILQNAVDTQSPIAIFEPVGRNVMSFVSMLFVILNVLLFTPFIRPIRWSVLPFIYLLPIVPLYIMWDGIASIFRIYSENELKELVSKLNNANSFHWEIDKIKNGPMPVYYLLGIPKKDKGG